MQRTWTSMKSIIRWQNITIAIRRVVCGPSLQEILKNRECFPFENIAGLKTSLETRPPPFKKLIGYASVSKMVHLISKRQKIFISVIKTQDGCFGMIDLKILLHFSRVCSCLGPAMIDVSCMLHILYSTNLEHYWHWILRTYSYIRIFAASIFILFSDLKFCWKNKKNIGPNDLTSQSADKIHIHRGARIPDQHSTSPDTHIEAGRTA